MERTGNGWKWLGLGLVLAVACDRAEWRSASGTLAAKPGLLEFGAAPLGSTKTVELRLVNQGRAPYRVEAARATAVNIAVPSFESFTLSSGEERAVSVTFSPEVEGKVQGFLELVTDSASAGEGGVARIAFKGQGVRSAAEVRSPPLDFGEVPLGTVELRELVLFNPTSVDAAVRLSFDGPDREAFSSSELADEVLVAPGETRSVPIAFQPARLGRAEGLARVLPCSECEPVTVQLSGNGAASFLEIDPSRVDFGRVALQTSVERRVTVRNQGRMPMTFEGARIVQSPTVAAFRLLAVPALAGNVLGPGASVEVRVAFTPQVPGPAPRALLELAVRPRDSTAPFPKIALLGEGGSGCVTVSPPVLDFGIVAEGMGATRSVSITNVCDAAVQVAELDLTPERGGDFTRDGPPSAVLAPGRKLSVPVRFVPREAERSEASLRFTVDGSAVEPVAVRGEGRLYRDCAYSFLPEALDFGRVNMGEVVSLGLSVRNDGDSDCYLASMRLAEGADPAFRAPRLPNQTLSPGEVLTLRVEFRPTEARSAQAEVEVLLNAPDDARPRVPVRGEGVESCFKLQPTSVDFGLSRSQCAPVEREVMAYNTCAEPVTLERLDLESRSAELTLARAPGLPLTLAAGAEASVALRYLAADEGDDLGALRFHVGSGAPYTVALSGTGLLGLERTDRFTQKAQAQVDVLFVIDNSGSMAEEQQSLGDNFAAFLSAAQALGVDYRIGVTTTGLGPSPESFQACPGGVRGGENGRLFPADRSSPRIITPATPDAARIFAVNTRVGICHWNEQGLDAALGALSDPLLHGEDDPRTPLPADGNAGFLREDAKLALIFVSDEEDLSSRAVGYYETYLRALKGNDPSKLTVSAIVGPEGLAGCPTASSAGTRYLALARATGGLTESICTRSWAQSLAALSNNTFGVQRIFPLSTETSDPGLIRVHVDGREVQGGWQYDARQHAVVFEEAAIPPVGSEVALTYPVRC